ncbi:MAG: hypothetical protein LBF66_02035 [Holosporales bacterium]|nr:hypothetical protein [Holosporales bacterium]
MIWHEDNIKYIVKKLLTCSLYIKKKFHCAEWIKVFSKVGFQRLCIHIPSDSSGFIEVQRIVTSGFVPRSVSRKPYSHLFGRWHVSFLWQAKHLYSWPNTEYYSIENIVRGENLFQWQIRRISVIRKRNRPKTCA